MLLSVKPFSRVTAQRRECRLFSLYSINNRGKYDANLESSFGLSAQMGSLDFVVDL